MRLPNADEARVDEAKITEYLLNPAHRFGSAKAAFFTQFGFNAKQWRVFARALREHGQRCPVVSVVDTSFGPRFSVEGPLECPDGRRPQIRTVWQLDEDKVAPRLITAYPCE